MKTECRNPKEICETPNAPVAVSACLLGVACRYDGGHALDAELTRRLAGVEVLPVCPEMMGGLPAPRPAVKIKGGDGGDVLDGRARIVTDGGEDRTASLVRGAEETLRLARARGASVFIGKARSPSCGSAADGVTAALLRRNEFEIIVAGE
jgi:uncharacterized protein YbbK (DUF523 family)